MQYLDKTGLARLWNNIKSKLAGKEDKSNKVTSITSSSTDIQYPSAKAVYNALQDNSNTIFDLVYPVGSYYETSDTSFNPNTTWGGTWELETDGTILVSKSSVSESIFNDTVGTIVGEEKHTLTVSELPSNVIQTATAGSNTDGYIMRGGYTATGTYNSGGAGYAHNNVQPSKIINRWHRTA